MLNTECLTNKNLKTIRISSDPDKSLRPNLGGFGLIDYITYLELGVGPFLEFRCSLKISVVA